MKVTVEVKEVWNHVVEVEIKGEFTREKAIEAANELIAAGDEGATEYNYTLDPDQWNVIDEDGYFH
jgi:hypothetical protein